MSSKSVVNTGVISITVEQSAKGGNTDTILNDISPSMTVGELKKKLNVEANSRFGRKDQFEDWDNRRPLSDYFVKNGELFQCVIQCMMEEGQSSFDDYDQWLAQYKS